MKDDLPLSLTLTIRIVGSLWVVGIATIVLGASWEIPTAALALGILADAFEDIAQRGQ